MVKKKAKSKTQDWLYPAYKKTHIRSKVTHRLKVRGWKNVFYINASEKKAGITIHISGKIDLKTKHVTRDKEETSFHND